MKHLIFSLFAILLIKFSFSQTPELINYQAVARDVSTGLPKINQTGSVRMTIRNAVAGTILYQETHSGVTTNQFGLFTVKIGGGTPVTGTFANVNWSTGNKFLEVEVDYGSGYENMGTTQLVSVPYALYAKEALNGPAGKNSLMNVTNAVSSSICTNGGYHIEVGTDLNGNTMLEASEVTDTFNICNGSAGLTAGNGVSIVSNIISNTGDLDSLDDKINSAVLNGTTIEITEGTTLWSINLSSLFTAIDTSNTNEIQALSLSGNTITLSNGGGTVNISSTSPNTGEVLYWNGINWVAQPLPVDNDSLANNEIITNFNINTTNDSLVIDEAGNHFAVPISSLSSNDTDWQQNTGIVYNLSDKVGIGVSMPVHKFDVISNDTIVAGFAGNNPVATAIGVRANNPSANAGVVLLSGVDTAVFGLDPTQNLMYLNHTNPAGNIFITTDSSILSQAMFIANYGVAEYNKFSNIYNEVDTVFYINTTNNVINVNKGTFYTDSLYVLGSNALNMGYVLTNVGLGQAKWLPPSGGSLWQSNTPDIYFNTGNVGIGTATPSEALEVQGNILVSQLSGAALPSAWVNLSGYDDGIAYSGMILKDALSNKKWNILHASVPNSNSFTIQEDNGVLTFDRFTILPGGNVGIGTSTPSSGLEIAGTSLWQSAISINNIGGGNDWRLGSTTSGVLNITKANGTTKTPVSISTNGLYVNDVLTIGDGTTYSYTFPSNQGPANSVLTNDGAGNVTWQVPSGGSLWQSNSPNIYFNTGNVGIGTNTPVTTLDVSGTSAFTAHVAIQNFANDNSEPRFSMLKSRGTTVGTNTIVQNNDVTGRIYGWGADGNSFWPTSLIEFAVDGTPSANNMPGRIVFSTTPLGSNIASERMRITNQGYVGIGTTAPLEKLQVSFGTLMIDDGVKPYKLPYSDGLNGEILTTDGGGNTYWAPNRVAFEAHPINTGQTISAGDWVVFDKIIFNDGGSFVLGSPDQFIAPYQGVYLIHANVTIQAQGAGNFRIQIQKDDGSIVIVNEAQEFLNNGDLSTLTVTSTLQLNAGDKISIFMDGTNSMTVFSADGTSFSGHLIYAY